MRAIDADAVKRSIWREWLCSRTIKEKELCDILEKIIVRCCEHIDAAPTIDAEPVRHGHWSHLGGDEWCCSNCGDVIFTEGSWEEPTSKYCQNCGAKMMDEVSE